MQSRLLSVYGHCRPFGVLPSSFALSTCWHRKTSVTIFTTRTRYFFRNVPLNIAIIYHRR